MSLGPYPLKRGSLLCDKRYETITCLSYTEFGFIYTGWDKNPKNNRTNGPKQVLIKELFVKGVCKRNKLTNIVEVDYITRNEFREIIQVFEGEANDLRFNARNALKVVEHVFQDLNTAYMVMIDHQGKNLKELIEEKKKLTPREAALILKGVAEVLIPLHKQQIFHKNLCWNSIKVKNSGRIWLTNFGTTKEFIINKKLYPLDTFHLTRGFASPEQYQDSYFFDAKMEVYSLTACFYYLTTGKKPVDAVNRLLNDDLLPLSKIDSSISKELNQIVMKGLAVFPKNRYENIEDFINVLVGEINKGARKPADKIETYLEPTLSNDYKVGKKLYEDDWVVSRIVTSKAKGTKESLCAIMLKNEDLEEKFIDLNQRESKYYNPLGLYCSEIRGDYKEGLLYFKSYQLGEGEVLADFWRKNKSHFVKRGRLTTEGMKFVATIYDSVELLEKQSIWHGNLSEKNILVKSTEENYEIYFKDFSIEKITEFEAAYVDELLLILIGEPYQKFLDEL